MTEHAPDRSDAIRELADVVAIASITGLRYRDFIARKAARVFMDREGLIFPGDDVGNAALEEVLGTGVATGIVLSVTGETTQEDVEVQVARLSSQIPTPLRGPFSALMPHIIRYGIDFHRDELVPGSDRVKDWTEEFAQLQAADPRHEFWNE